MISAHGVRPHATCGAFLVGAWYCGAGVLSAASAGAVEDQDSEPPINASGDKGAEGPGDQAEGEDTDKA